MTQIAAQKKETPATFQAFREQNFYQYMMSLLVCWKPKLLLRWLLLLFLEENTIILLVIIITTAVMMVKLRSVTWVYGVIHKPERIVVTLSIVQVYDRHIVHISCKERM